VIKRITKGRNPKPEVVDIGAIVKKVARIADEKKADYIKILDMRSRLIITDYFVIISARNTRLTRRIQEEIYINLKNNKRYPINISGLSEGNWILVDYDDFVIHIFTNEFKEYYKLEKLWRDSKEIKWN
jgi:ribosome-associated protein